MFKSLKTIPQLCKEFKDNAVAQFEQSKELVSVEITDLETFFSYKSDHFESTWIPKQVRDDLLKLGVHLQKIRGRTYVVVHVKGITDKLKGKKKSAKKSNTSK